MRVRVPDLVLVDWYMPGYSGVSFVHALRADPTKILVPVIMLTARDDELDMVLAFDAAVDDYVNKTFNTCELLARVSLEYDDPSIREAVKGLARESDMYSKASVG